ncbi:MAG: hypothetical protein HVN35_00950 [Methanobacteriaceae archaeon]|nr:hypothetical protein [Methanobacteriaceae archaeon]
MVPFDKLNILGNLGINGPLNYLETTNPDSDLHYNKPDIKINCPEVVLIESNLIL